jgi:hypothetical protein
MSDRAVDAISWIVVGVAILAFFDPWLGYCEDLIALGLAFMALGSLFVVAYYRTDASKVLRALIWFCERLSAPAGKKVAYLWCFFFVLLGALALVHGLGLVELSGFHRGRVVFDDAKAEAKSCKPYVLAR